MKPDFFDTLARAAISRAGRLPPARDALAPPLEPGSAARTGLAPPARSAIRAKGNVARAAPPEADVEIERAPMAPPRGAAAAARPGVRAPAPSTRTPPKMDLRGYLERRRGRP